MRWYSITLFATSLASVLVAASAQAQVARTFVSTAGSDSNNCANVATPCRHFQTAVNATAPGGDVVALDPGNYGAIRPRVELPSMAKAGPMSHRRVAVETQ